MWELYLITILDSTDNISVVIAMLSLVAFCILLVALTEYHGEETKNAIRKWIKRVVVICGISIVLVIFIPSKKDMYIMFGLGSAIDYIQDSDKAKELPEKTITLINQTLDKLIEENKE